jgi:hypothetical protein
VVFMKGVTRKGKGGAVKDERMRQTRRPTSENWRLQRSERCRVDIPPKAHSRSPISLLAVIAACCIYVKITVIL